MVIVKRRDSMVLVCLGSLASTMLKLPLDDNDGAENLLRCSLAIKESELGLEDVFVAHALHILGACMHATGRKAGGGGRSC